MTCHCEKKRAFVKLVIGFGLRRFDFHGSAREAFFYVFYKFFFFVARFTYLRSLPSDRRLVF